jgi:hypothetical protein
MITYTAGEYRRGPLFIIPRSATIMRIGVGGVFWAFDSCHFGNEVSMYLRIWKREGRATCMGVSQSILSGPMNQRAMDGTGSGIGGIIEIKMAAKLYIDNARSIVTSSCRAALVEHAKCEYIISFQSVPEVALSVKHQM